jgi:hypothetical protein
VHRPGEEAGRYHHGAGEHGAEEEALDGDGDYGGVEVGDEPEDYGEYYGEDVVDLGQGSGRVWEGGRKGEEDIRAAE